MTPDGRLLQAAHSSEVSGVRYEGFAHKSIPSRCYESISFGPDRGASLSRETESVDGFM